MASHRMEDHEKTGYGYEALNVEDEDDEEVPITRTIKTPPPPPPPPPAPEVIEIVEDEEEVEETVIESTETDQEEIVEVEDIEVEDDFEDVDVPFAVIEDVPIYPGCENVPKSQRRACFKSKSINTFARTSVTQRLHKKWEFKDEFMFSSLLRKTVITSVRMCGPDKNLEKEAARIISKLPKNDTRESNGDVQFVSLSVFRLHSVCNKQTQNKLEPEGNFGLFLYSKARENKEYHLRRIIFVIERENDHACGNYRRIYR